ncbi:hypothetical protein, partial [Vibrio ichthyoenteri]|uniref:hypothetical protein n=1 Tax=Vibrio ichthyoenteri TaxID=142461 RepID=UPI0019D37923
LFSTLIELDSRLRSFVAIGNDVIEVPRFCCHPQERGTSELGIYSLLSNEAKRSQGRSPLSTLDAQRSQFSKESKGSIGA